MYSFIQVLKGEDKTYTMYFVMEYITCLSIQKGKEWAYKTIRTIFGENGSCDTDYR